jgi:hypothetical protein
VEDHGAGGDRRCVGGVDVCVRLDREREVMETGCIQLELLVVQRLPEAERSRPGRREAEVVDLLAALPVDEMWLLETKTAEDRGVERQRPLQVPADDVDVADAGEHRYLRMLTARATTITASDRLIADCASISIFDQRLSGSVSVGLNADAFVYET